MVCSLPFITTTNRFLSHNNLPPETSLPINEKKHINHILEMIRECNAANEFGVIALHQHKTLLPDHSFVGHIEKLNKSYCYWIRDLANERINLDKVYGSKFAYVEGEGLYPFEFCQGQMPDLSGVDKALFQQIGQYLVKNNLTSRLGLGLLRPELSKNKMTEFPRYRGMVQVPTKLLLPKDLETVETEWHWDSATGIYGAGTNCVILRSGEHVRPKTDDEEPTNFDDIVRQLVRDSIMG